MNRDTTPRPELEHLLSLILGHLRAEIAAVVREELRKATTAQPGTLFWDTEQTAAFISPRCTPDQVRALIASGELRAIRQNPDRPKSPWLVDPESVVEWKRRAIDRDAIPPLPLLATRAVKAAGKRPAGTN